MWGRLVSLFFWFGNYYNISFELSEIDFILREFHHPQAYFHEFHLFTEKKPEIYKNFKIAVQILLYSVCCYVWSWIWEFEIFQTKDICCNQMPARTFYTMKSKARRARSESLTFLRQEKVKSKDVQPGCARVLLWTTDLDLAVSLRLITSNKGKIVICPSPNGVYFSKSMQTAQGCANYVGNDGFKYYVGDTF